MTELSNKIDKYYCHIGACLSNRTYAEIHRVDPRTAMIKQRRKIMGRPLNKRYFGITKDGDDLTNEGRLTVSVKVGANTASALGIILSQRSETKFNVSDGPDGDDNGGGAGSANNGVCTLVNKATGSLAANEMSLQGFVDGESAVYIRKVQNRTMLDFDNNRYTWAIEDDSTSNVLVLTAI